ncbi:MAG TPA: adenylosuccinate lyase, partial [Acidimicrobiales bacterium]|nr:adenylosuccinate lyase [Acidimicrobiales bacterium]
RTNLPWMVVSCDQFGEGRRGGGARYVISRYTRPQMAVRFDDVARFSAWLEVEILAVEAWAKLGVVPQEDADVLRATAPKIDEDFVESVSERERTTDHDVAAFVDVVQERVGGTAGPWVHYGLTSMDVVDTAQCYIVTGAVDALLLAMDGWIAALVALAENHRNTVCVGRTHGIHAEPTTFGMKVALWALQADRDRTRLRAARQSIAVGRLSGPVGTYSNIDPSIEDYVCGKLGLTPVPSTQVIARDRHAEFLYAVATIGATIELVATEIRHLQRTEVGEAREAFRTGQKGSSAMPHKRNPIKSENLTGLARVMRSYIGPGLEDVALWHERDISHSSVERIVLADAAVLTDYALARATDLVANLVVDPERMRENLDASYGLVFSQPVLLALVATGMPRDEAYRIVQRNAMQAWETRTPFRQLLEADPEVTVDLDEAFDLTRSLRHIDRTFDALKEIS